MRGKGRVKSQREGKEGALAVLASETVGTVFLLAKPPVGVLVTAAELTNACTSRPVPAISEWRR